jgi:hypothetical protein
MRVEGARFVNNQTNLVARGVWRHQKIGRVDPYNIAYRFWSGVGADRAGAGVLLARGPTVQCGSKCV